MGRTDMSKTLNAYRISRLRNCSNCPRCRASIGGSHGAATLSCSSAICMERGGDMKFPGTSLKTDVLMF
ncbi:hypothetical protein DBV15_09596 [Temnothorax longispinosus]|uniref:Uncharacterized protein n=1 Tax=Temnothorax longispinosus TaxID=300112 RepID=A0A4S2KEL0_9HYME|nr:hypothetical protein DBV15_09596 [Temnothorax longispinosus]